MKPSLVLVLWALMASLVFAADYYIDAIDGNDTTGDGSEASPWRTLTYANSQTQNRGTEANPVVLHALPGVYSPSTNGETFPIEFNQAPDYLHPCSHPIYSRGFSSR